MTDDLVSTLLEGSLNHLLLMVSNTAGLQSWEPLLCPVCLTSVTQCHFAEAKKTHGDDGTGTAIVGPFLQHIQDLKCVPNYKVYFDFLW